MHRLDRDHKVVGDQHALHSRCAAERVNDLTDVLDSTNHAPHAINNLLVWQAVNEMLKNPIDNMSPFDNTGRAVNKQEDQMARRKKEETETSTTRTPVETGEIIRLSEVMSKQPTFARFGLWIIGCTPLITHAWSFKAKDQMLSKQVKATRAGKDARNPEEDFKDSLYDMGDDTYGFPVTGIKNAVLSASHKDKGIPKTTVMSALYFDADMVRVRPALNNAICDMPLVRIYGSKPEMREDMVRVGVGLQKTATLAYRAQFTTWAMRLTGEINVSVLEPSSLHFLVEEAGKAYGIGEWRNERKGIFGQFRIGKAFEEKEWDRFAAGKGPMPKPIHEKRVDITLVAAE